MQNDSWQLENIVTWQPFSSRYGNIKIWTLYIYINKNILNKWSYTKKDEKKELVNPENDLTMKMKQKTDKRI